MNLSPEAGENFWCFISRCTQYCRATKMFTRVTFNGIEIPVHPTSCPGDLSYLYTALSEKRFAEKQLETTLEVAQKVADRVDALEEQVRESLSTQCDDEPLNGDD